MNPYTAFAGSGERFSRAEFSSLQVTRKTDDETFVDEEPVDNRLDQLAAEFVERTRQGDQPTIDEYATRFPDLADEIHDLFPTVARIEGLKVQFENEQHPVARRGLVAGNVPLSQLGDFRIIREIGRGGMGVVYEAEQMSLGRRVAIKALPLLSVGQPELVRRFQREARTAARLHHTNIVPVFGVGEAEGFHYYVMQLIDGIGLDTFTGDSTGTASGSVASQLMTELAVEIDERPPVDRHIPDSTPASKPGPGLEAHGPRRQVESSDSVATVKSLPGAVPPDGVAERKPVSSPLDELMHDDSTSLSLPSHPRVNASDSAVVAVIRPKESDSGTKAEEPVSAAGNDVVRMRAAAVIHNSTRFQNSGAIGQSSYRVPKADGLTIPQIVDAGIQAADALQYAHAQGTLHRDIKPGNLMLDGDGVVWVTDFGLAKAMEGDDITHTENVVGTVRYMAPEQFRGQTDCRSDIYSLGLTLYELVTGQRAWAATSRSGLISEIIDGQLVPLRHVVPDAHRDLETIILTATARDAQHRYQSAGDLAEDLRRFAHDQPILARRASVVERLWRWGRRNPVVAGLSLATTLSLTLFAAAAALGYTAERDQRERAEATTELALEALDRIFEKFAPGDSMAASAPALADEGASNMEHAVLSPEAARLLAGLLEFYERLARQSDGDPGLLLKCAQARQRVGDIYQRLGKYRSAIDSYRLAMADYEKLASPDQDDSSGLPALVRAGLLNGVGACELMLARQKESRSSHQAAMDLLDTLPSELQQRPEVRFEKARTYSLLARRLKPGESVSSLWLDEPVQGIGRHGGLPMEPNRPGRRDQPLHPVPEPRHESSTRDTFAAGHAEDRRAHLAGAISLLEELLSEEPDVARYRFLLALCLRESTQSRDGRMTPELNRACRLLESLVEQYPDRPAYRLALADSYAHVEVIPERLRPDVAERAEASLAMAAEHAQLLVEEHPTVPAYSISLIHISSRLAGIKESLARDAFGQQYRSLISDAERNLRTAIELQESLVRREPDVATFHLWVARFRNSLARVLRQQGRLDESRQMLEYAIERLSECPISIGESVVLVETRGQLHHNLGVTLRSMDRVEDAVAAMLTAEEYFDQAATKRAHQAD